MHNKNILFISILTIVFTALLLMPILISGDDGKKEFQIDSCLTLKEPGIYFVTKDIKDDKLTDSCIIINSKNVTLDCQGNSISSTEFVAGVYSNQPNTVIQNCEIQVGNEWGGFGIYLNGATNATVQNNNLHGSYTGVYLYQVTDGQIINNNISDNYNRGLHVSLSSKNIIARNNISDNNFYGILSTKATENVYSNNYITKNYDYNIFIQEASDGNKTGSDQILNNFISNSSTNIYLKTSNNIIRKNIITYSDGIHGLYIWNASGNIIENNLISNSGRSGLKLVLVKDTQVIKNIIKDSGEEGLTIDKSDSVTLTGNEFCSNVVNINCSSEQIFTENYCGNSNVCGGQCLPCSSITEGNGEWDNVKTYDKATQVVTIKNTLGLGADILTVKLDTPQIYQVRTGYQKVMQFTINPYTDYQNLLGSLEFKDLNDKEKLIQKQIDLKYWGLEDYDVDDYTCTEFLDKNGSIGEDCKKTGKHTEQRYNWIAWDKRVYRSKQVIVGLFTEVGVNERVDILPTIAGVKIPEWAVYTSGNVTTIDGLYTVVTYLNNGTFNVTDAGFNVELLVVGGGGGGGSGTFAPTGASGGGGGAGAYKYNSSFIITAQNYSVVVGAGGNAVNGLPGLTGSSSSFGTVNAAGGGGGGAGATNGLAGANGGGGAGGGNPTAGGAGTDGNAGGNGKGTAEYVGGGGGGATNAGSAGSAGGAGIGGAGGNGTSNSINGTAVFYAGGGGGASGTVGYGGNGGKGGGGAGGGASVGTAGTNGLGGGGGAGAYKSGVDYYVGANGGSGVVIIRYLTTASPTQLEINYTTPTEANNSNVTQNWIYVNVSKNMTSEANITFNLYNGTSSFCYQESANTTNQTGVDGNCGLNYGGEYIFSGSWVSNSNFYDGVWNTYASQNEATSGITGTVIFNYTLPPNAVGAIWQIKLATTTVTMFNYSLLGCFNSTMPNLRFLVSNYINMDSSSGTDWYCYNYTTSAFVLLKSYAHSSRYYSRAYEEAVYWNVSTPLINQTTYTDNRTYINWTDLAFGDYWYQVTVTNTSNSQNSTELRKITLLTSLIYPQLNYTSPTPDNNTYLAANSFTVAVNYSTPNFENSTFRLYNSTNELINETNVTRTLNSSYRSSWNSDGAFWLDVSNTHDMNWNSAGYVSMGTTGTLYENYTNFNSATTNYTFKYNTNAGNGYSVYCYNYSSSNFDLLLDLSSAVGTGTSSIALPTECLSSPLQIIINITSITSTAGFYESEITYPINSSSLQYNLIDGVYYYNVTVFDLNGLSNSTETRKITLDATYPQIEFVPLTEANNSNKSQNWIYANVSVNETNEANITFNLYTAGYDGLCYQESANTSNQKGTDGSCGLNYSGTYAYDGNSWDNKSYFYDGDWDTATTQIDPGSGYIYAKVYVDYIKPAGTVGAIWQTKDVFGTYNNTLSSGCLNSNIISLRGQSAYDYNDNQYSTLWWCYDWDASSWIYFTPHQATLPGIPYLYEEAMYWNISTGLISNTTFTNNTREINWTDLYDGTFLYNVNTCDILGLCNSTGTRKITLDATFPQINYIAPTPDDNNYTSNDNFTIAVSVIESNLATIGYSVIYSNNTEVSYSTNAAPTLKKTIYLPPAYVNYSISQSWWEGYAPGSTVEYIWYYANGSDSGLQPQIITSGYYTYYNPEPSQLITKIEIYLARGGSGGTVYERNTRVHFSTIYNGTSQEFTNLSEGTYYYNVTASDFADNKNTTETRNITIDRTAPNIVITFPLNTSYTVNPTTLNYTSNEPNSGICWYSTDAGVTNNTFTCGTDITELTPAQGENTWMIKIEDKAFNVNEAYVAFFLDSINPAISFQIPTETDGSYINRTNIQINVSASDTNLMDIIIKVYDSIYTEVANAFWTNVASNNFWFNFVTPSNGLYYFNATATDIYGNVNYTETRNVTTDTIYPIIAYSTPTTPAGGPQNVTAIWSNMTGTDTNLVTIVSTLELISGGTAYSNTQTYTPTIAPIDSLYYNWTGLGQGIYRLSGYATDRVNHTTYIANRSINIDTAAPVMNYVSPTPDDGDVVYVNSYTVNVTALDPNLIGITINYWQLNGTVQTQTTASAVNTLTRTAQPDGIYYFNASAIDADSRISWLATREINIQYANQTVEACKELYIENGNYIIIDDLTSSTTCLNVTAKNININCQGHSITGNDAILANKPGLILRNCIMNSPTKSALKILGNSPSSVTVYNSTFTGSTYGINIAPEGNLYADTITVTNNDYGIYFNGSNNGNTLRNVLMSGNVYDSITFLNSSFNTITNLTILTTVDTGNNGIVVFNMSTDNYFDGCIVSAVNPKIWGLYNYSIKNTLYSCYYGDSSHDSVDVTSQLIRSWPFTGSVLDSVRNKLQGASIRYTASLPTNRNVSYYNSTDNITYTTLGGVTYTNSGALAQTNITEYMNIGGTTYLSTPYFFNASYNIFTPTSATLNMNSSSTSRFHEFLLGNEIGSSQLSRIAMWLILGIVFLVGLAASIGFFVVRMRDGYSVVDIWKYFMILIIWLTMFTIMYYALAWFIMGTVYPKV